MRSPPSYPADTATVVRLLSAVEYDVTADTLLGYLTEKSIPPVQRLNGRLAWSATNITTAACALEARRKWKPFSTLHGHKKTMIERLQEIYAREGTNGGTAFSDLADFDYDALLALLIQAGGDAGAVSCLAEALRQKLKQQGVL